MSVELCRLVGSVYFATVGYTPDKVAGALRARSEVTRLVVFHGHESNVGTRRALDQLARTCQTRGIELERVELADPFLLGVALKTFRRAAERHRPSAFNVSGGTNIMQVAAVLTCSLLGIQMESYNVEVRGLQRLPPIRLESPVARGATTLQVVRHLARHPGQRPLQVASALGISPSRLSYHLGRLRTAG
ncbi:MAG TPA: DUF6293 family protein, partial [Candidatus Thermoplasmatota archaeon]|nr:DUF6293 family protein [Candidatus Thermoplasmatota archaeon]